MTFILGVMGVVASFNGLKLSIAFNILLDVMGLIRMRIDNVFRVASTIRTSLQSKQDTPSVAGSLWQRQLQPYLFSCRTLSIRSRSPVASASMAFPLRTEWSLGTIFREMSSGSPRYSPSAYLRSFLAQQGRRTLGSRLILGVWARITRCANLMQHMRRVRGAVSQSPRILVLIAVMVFHVLVS